MVVLLSLFLQHHLRLTLLAQQLCRLFQNSPALALRWDVLSCVELPHQLRSELQVPHHHLPVPGTLGTLPDPLGERPVHHGVNFKPTQLGSSKAYTHLFDIGVCTIRDPGFPHVLLASSSKVDLTKCHPLESWTLPAKLLHQGCRHGQWDPGQEERHWMVESFQKVILVCQVCIGMNSFIKS